MAPKREGLIKIPPGTTINFGDHEDGDFFVVTGKTGLWAIFLGLSQVGSKLIRIIENRQPSREIFHWHQPKHKK